MTVSTTLCWRCSQGYIQTQPECPNCGAANGNVNLILALMQQGEFEASLEEIRRDRECLRASIEYTQSQE